MTQPTHARPTRKAAIEAKIEKMGNGVAGFLKNEIAESEKRIMAALRKASSLPDTWADRMLRRCADSHHSYAWVALYTLFAVVAGAAIQAWVIGG